MVAVFNSNNKSRFRTLKRQEGIKNLSPYIQRYLEAVEKPTNKPKKLKDTNIVRTVVNLPKPVTVTRRNNKHNNRRFATTLKQANKINITNMPSAKGYAFVSREIKPSFATEVNFSKPHKVKYNNLRLNMLPTKPKLTRIGRVHRNKGTRHLVNNNNKLKNIVGINENAVIMLNKKNKLNSIVGINENAVAKLN